MVDPDDVAAYVGGLCHGVSDADQASIRACVHDGGYRVVRLRDLQGVPSPTFLERHETTGCCGNEDMSTGSCVHGASGPQHMVSPLTSNTVALLGRVVTSTTTRTNDAWQGLYLSDGDTAIPMVVARPDIACLHQLVLITTWKCIQARTFVYLEVESVAMQLTSARSILPVSMTWESLLTTCYPTCDGPVYGGPYPVQRALAKRSSSKPWSTKSRHFVVAGRVACISPICTQVDAQYYFIEVEVGDDSSGVARHREFISVLMAGHSTAFHPFLWPGQDIVLTDLVKVFAKECNMYMLHTTTSPSFAPTGDWSPPHHDAHTTLHHVTVATRSPLPPFSIHRALPQHDPDAPPPTTHLTGQLTRRLCDDSFELNHAVVVIFAHFPLPNRCAGHRVGATISIYHSHQLGPALVGLCSRSSVVLDAFACGRSPMLLQPRSSRVQELAFHQVPLTTVAYLLELSQDVLRRFSSRSSSWSPSATDNSRTMPPPVWDVFQEGNMRKQTLLRLVATSAGVTWRPRPTLGHSFLCHSSTTCFSASPAAKPTLGPAVSLQSLVDTMVNRSNGRSADDAPEDNRTHQFVYPSSDEPQPSILLLGCIQGSMATNDLHLVDRTATVPLVVVRPGDVALARPSTLYHLITYDVVVTRVPLPDNDNHSFGPCTAHARAIYSATHVTHVHIRCHALRPIMAKPADDPSIVDDRASTRRRLLVLRIDGLPQSSSVGGATHFLVHGVLLPLSHQSIAPTASESDWCVVQVLVPRASLPWYVHAQSVWDVRLGKAPPQRVEFTPPLASLYAFDYHLAKFKQRVRGGAGQTPTQWHDVHTEAKVADALVQYRITADAAATEFKWVATLFSPAQDNMDDPSTLWHAMASHYDAVQSPSSLLVIPLPTPSSSTDAAQPHPSVFEDRVVSIVGTVTDLVVVDLYEYRHHGNATSESHDCVLQVTIQDENTPDTVSVGLWMDRDQRRHKWPSGLALGVRVVFHRVKLRVRKRGFKLDMVQVHATAVTLRCDAQMRYARDATAGFGQQKLLIVPRGLHNAIETAHMDAIPARMIDMYQHLIVDRRVHRFVATVSHISYAILKCICRHCRGPLTTDTSPVGHRDRRPLLRHDEYNMCSQAPSPMVTFRLRCIVDDATAQIELHCDGDVAWDLLQMPQRDVYETLTMEQGGEVAFFSSNDGTVGTREAIWRKAVVDAMSKLGQVSIHARRFYGKANSESTSAGQGPPMSVLRCGDFSVRTPVQPMVHMEATSVDVVHTKAELRRLLRST